MRDFCRRESSRASAPQGSRKALISRADFDHQKSLFSHSFHALGIESIKRSG
jgi:hypothetical protein